MRHLTTSAFKIAGGISMDSGSSVLRVTQQNAMSPAFTGKIVKVFLDAIYTVLDGMVVLVAEEVPPGVASVSVAVGAAEREGKQELIDLRDSVSDCFVRVIPALIQLCMKEYETAPCDIEFLAFIRIVDTRYAIPVGECAWCIRRG
jgi:hypothetical protein